MLPLLFEKKKRFEFWPNFSDFSHSQLSGSIDYGGSNVDLIFKKVKL